ncbi:MAG TPA: DUF488 family protein [Solirubrobacteraceae bacterium]
MALSQDRSSGRSKQQASTFSSTSVSDAVRGSRYSFANASRLQADLSARGIDYLHIRDLAPSTDTRQLQKLADAAVGTTKAERQALTPAFIAAYEERNTKPFDWDDLVAALGEHNAPVIFCVERTPVSSETGSSVT